MFERVEQILYKVYQSRRTSYSDRQLGSCGVCGNSALFVRKENYEKRFCSNLCNGADVGLSELFPLGMKRVLETVDQSLWLQDLPSEILAQIILMIFDFRILSVSEWSKLGKIRKEFEEVKKLKDVIDTQVIPGFRFVSPDVLERLPFQGIGVFLGLTHLEFPLDKIGNWTPILTRMRNLTSIDMRIYYYQESTIDLTQLTQIKKLVVFPSAKNEFIQNLTHITNLSLFRNRKIMMDVVTQLTQLTALDLSGRNDKLRDISLQSLSNLTKLSLENNLHINNADIVLLTGLTKLNIRNSNIGKEALSLLTNLTSLNVGSAEMVNDETLERMTQLKSLHFHGATKIKDNTIKQLTNLTKLSLVGYEKRFSFATPSGYRTSPDINEALLFLTDLTSLDITDNYRVEDYHLNNLTKLHFLNIRFDGSRITNHALQRMTNLRILDIVENEKVTPDIIPFLPELQEIRLSADQYIEGGFKTMEKSIYLKISLY